MDADSVILSRIAERLGWPMLERNVHRLNSADAERFGVPEFAWYTSGSYDDVALHINGDGLVNKPGPRDRYYAAVYAIRYRLACGHFGFRLPTTPAAETRLVVQLDNWLNRLWFSTGEGRRAFRRLHPECAGLTWTKLRARKLPFERGRTTIPPAELAASSSPARHLSKLVGKLERKAPIADRELTRVQNVLGFALPPEYVHLLRLGNGAEGWLGPRKNADVMLSSLTDAWKDTREYQEFCPEWMFIFASSGGGQAYAFDCRRRPVPVYSTDSCFELVRPAGRDLLDFLERLAARKD